MKDRLRSVDRLIALAGPEHVSGYTRKTKTGKTVHVSSYTRDPGDMANTELYSEFKGLSGKTSDPQARNRLQRVVTEIRKRQNSGEWQKKDGGPAKKPVAPAAKTETNAESHAPKPSSDKKPSSKVSRVSRSKMADALAKSRTKDPKSSATRDVKSMDSFELAREAAKMDAGEYDGINLQHRMRRKQIEDEQRDRGLNPKWEAHLAALLDSPLDAGTLEDLRGEYGVSIHDHLVTDAEGNTRVSPERQKLHKEILDKALSNGKVSTEKRFNMMGGGPASGKGVMVDQDPTISEGAVIINPDDVKAEIPEYHQKDGTKEAGVVHEESSYLAKVMQAEAFNRSFNVTLDGTGNSKPDKLRRKIMQARENGYSVNGYYVTIDTETALARAESRGRRTGRFVNPEVVRQTHANVSATVAEVYPEFDSLRLFDTDVPKGSKPTPVMEFHRGRKTKIHDKKLWAKFLAKAGEGE